MGGRQPDHLGVSRYLDAGVNAVWSSEGVHLRSVGSSLAIPHGHISIALGGGQHLE